MILPEGTSEKQLAIPFRLIYWSCGIAKNTWIGVLLIPMALVSVGIVLALLFHEEISRGVWLAMLWTSMTFAILYFSQYKIQQCFDQLKGIIPNTKDAEEIQEQVRIKIFAYSNNKYYYLVGIVVILITFPAIRSAFIIHYSSTYLQGWCWIFFPFTAFVGGYGMAYGMAFSKIIEEIVKNTPFELNPFHPDLFMGLKPLGNLSVAVALGASSSSLLFPLIFETIRGDLSVFFGYLIFGIIMLAIIVSFLGPLFIVKNRIEDGKFAALMLHEAEYQQRLANYKNMPTTNDKEILQMLLIEKAKLQEIRLFPFETRMIFQIIVSILLPIVMLLLQLHLGK